MTKRSFAKACMDQFGKLPGQTLTQFNEELKAAKEGDGLAYFTREFAKIGVEIEMAPNA